MDKEQVCLADPVLGCITTPQKGTNRKVIDRGLLANFEVCK